MCTGTTIKPMVGDAANCSTSCDGKTNVANSEHTACGLYIMNPSLHTKTSPNYVSDIPIIIIINRKSLVSPGFKSGVVLTCC